MSVSVRLSPRSGPSCRPMSACRKASSPNTVSSQVLNLGNSPRLHQARRGQRRSAMTSGADLRFRRQGRAARAVASFRDRSAQYLDHDARLQIRRSKKNVADLQGSAYRDLRHGLGQRMAGAADGIQEGWGKDGVLPTPLGSGDANLAALRTHQVGAMVAVGRGGAAARSEGIGRMVTTMGKYAPHFHAHMMFVRKPAARSEPGAGRSLPQGVLRLDRFHESRTRRRPWDREPGAAYRSRSSLSTRKSMTRDRHARDRRPDRSEANRLMKNTVPRNGHAVDQAR